MKIYTPFFILMFIFLVGCTNKEHQNTSTEGKTIHLSLENPKEVDLTYIIHSGFISGYQNRYGDNLKPPTNVYHRMTA